jgi:hypothetical protein
MDRRELGNRARLAEQAERYDDMANYMKKCTLAAKEGENSYWWFCEICFAIAVSVFEVDARFLELDLHYYISLILNF